MTSSITTQKTQCVTCEKSIGIFTCGGCARAFCTRHANEHRQILGHQMDEITVKYDQLSQNISEKLDEISQCSAMVEISEWEKQSIEKIRRIADNARQKLKEYIIDKTQYIRREVQKLTEKINKARIEDDFVETDLKLWMDKINTLKIDIFANIPVSFKNVDDNLILFFSEHQFNSDTNDLFDQGYDDVSAKEKYKSTFPLPNDRENFHLRIIELQKTAERLGFRVSGTVAEKSHTYISYIVPNGAAWNQGGLRRGDQILSVNGVSVENEYHEKVVEMLKQAEGRVKLVVRYSPADLFELESRFENKVQ